MRGAEGGVRACWHAEIQRGMIACSDSRQNPMPANASGVIKILGIVYFHSLAAPKRLVTAAGEDTILTR